MSSVAITDHESSRRKHCNLCHPDQHEFGRWREYREGIALWHLKFEIVRTVMSTSPKIQPAESQAGSHDRMYAYNLPRDSIANYVLQACLMASSSGV